MTGLVILAAGSSSRLGQPKQNLVLNGKTLLQHALDAAVNSMCNSVVLVLGANADSIKPPTAEKQFSIVHNYLWQEGMASSIRTGLTELLKADQKPDSVVFMLCDQPYADEHLINNLVSAKQNNEIVSCVYNDTFGVPALFNARYFDELLDLKGQDGAKKILERYKENVISIPFSMGVIDVDTIEDYERLNLNKPNY